MRVPDNRRFEIPETQRPREGWDKAIAGMAANDDDWLLDQVVETRQA